LCDGEYNTLRNWREAITANQLKSYVKQFKVELHIDNGVILLKSKERKSFQTKGKV